jgi:hypothetical protein
VAVVAAGEFPDPAFPVAATSPDFVEAAEVSAGDPGPLSVFIGCVFSMMHTFLTIKLDPMLFEFLLAATM